MSKIDYRDYIKASKCIPNVADKRAAALAAVHAARDACAELRDVVRETLTSRETFAVQASSIGTPEHFETLSEIHAIMNAEANSLANVVRGTSGVYCAILGQDYERDVERAISQGHHAGASSCPCKECKDDRAETISKMRGVTQA